MKTLTGPGLFLAQFAQDTPPHNSLEAIARWAKNYGYKGIQIPSWDKRFFDLDKAADSNAYCDEVKGKLGGYRHPDHRALDPFPGPDGLGASRL